MVPGQQVNISHFCIGDYQMNQTSKWASGTSRCELRLDVIDRGLEENIVSYKTDQAVSLSPDLMQHLNEFTDHLLKLSSPSELYSQACLHLADLIGCTCYYCKTALCSSEPAAKVPQHSCMSISGTVIQQIYTTLYVYPNLHLSQRVYWRRARTQNKPVMASSGPCLLRNETGTDNC